MDEDVVKKGQKKKNKKDWQRPHRHLLTTGGLQRKKKEEETFVCIYTHTYMCTYMNIRKKKTGGAFTCAS